MKTNIKINVILGYVAIYSFKMQELLKYGNLFKKEQYNLEFKMRYITAFFVFFAFGNVSAQTVYLNQDTGYQGFGVEDLDDYYPITLPSSITDSQAPSDGYRISFSWAANHGSNGAFCSSGYYGYLRSPSLALRIYVNGIEYWRAVSPNNHNYWSNYNQAINGASFVSGTTGAWNMTCGTLAETPNRTAEIRLPSSVGSIISIELRLNIINPGCRDADDGIIRLNSVVTGGPLNTTSATNDSFSTTADIANNMISANVLGNDFDPEGHTQTVTTTPIDDVDNGTLVLNTDGSFTYVPDPGFEGQDSFVYQVCDQLGACDQATVIIIVSKFLPPNYFVSVVSSNTNIVGPNNDIDFIVFIGESNDQDANGIDSVEFRILKSDDYTIDWAGSHSLTTLNGTPVSNSNWEYDDSHPTLYRFTYKNTFLNDIFKRNTFSEVGIKAVFNSPQNGSGSIPLKVTIKSHAGGQECILDDNDTEFIVYTNK